MTRLFRGGVTLLLAFSLTACSIFSSDDVEIKTPKRLEPLADEQVRLVEVWSRSVGKGAGTSFESLKPAADGDFVFVTGANGEVSALARDTGDVVWRKKLDVTVGGGVSANAGMVLLGTLNGEVIALNQENGEELWRSRVSSEILSAPVTDGQYVAVQSIDDRLTVFNAQTGGYLWRQDTLQPPLTLRGSASPLLFTEAVFAGFANGEAKAFRLQNGAPLWSARIVVPKGRTELERMVDVRGTPLIVGDTIYFTSFQGNVSALELYSGRVRWTRELSSFESMADGFGSIYATSADSYVSSIDQRSGASNWRQQDFEFRQLSAPATFSSYLVVGDGEGYLHVLSQVDGSQIGRRKVASAAIKAQPVVDIDLILVMTADGELVALKEEATESEDS